MTTSRLGLQDKPSMGDFVSDNPAPTATAEGREDSPDVTRQKEGNGDDDAVNWSQVDESAQHMKAAPPPERFMSTRLSAPSMFEAGSGFFWIKINPGVFCGSLAIIWGFIIWAAADTEGASENTSEWDSYLTKHFAWLYIGSVNIFLAVSLYMIVSKYGDIVLGRPGDKPKYSYASWFSMLFSAGIGIGLFFFGVGEPVFHYAYPNRHSHQFMTTCQDESTSASCFTPESRDYRALQAMNLSWYHWGFGASCCYVVVGLPIALYHYKYGQPLTMRTAMFPILGNRIYGWFGDVVEIAATIGTVYGVCTSLGLGVTQIAGGLTRIDNSVDNESIGTKVAIIWIITAIATVSVVLGVDVGIKRISEANFILGIFILSMFFFFGNMSYILDFGISEWGFHLQYWFSLSWASDGIAKTLDIPNYYNNSQLINGTWWEAPKYTGGGVTNNSYSSWPSLDAQLTNGDQFGYDHGAMGTLLPSWMANWTTFYWAWWISWSPFVGLFIARISGGRTIREFVLGNMFVPTMLTCLWLLIFGGRGLEFEMQALQAGWTCDKCNAIEGYEEGYVGCALLSCRGWDMDRMLFDMIEMFPFKDFMTVVTTLGISLYFVTSSDSASAVIDQIASNGEKEGPIWQRVFWAVTEGLTATVVLASAGEDSDVALKALRSISLISALPFCFIMLLSCAGFIRFLSIMENPEKLAKLKKMMDFNINVFDSWFRVVFNTLSLGLLGSKTGDNILNTFQALFLPAMLQIRNISKLGGNVPLWSILFLFPNVGLLVFGVMAVADVEGAFALFGTSWLMFFSVGVACRMMIRERLNVAGTFGGDVCSWMWCGSAAAYQEYMALHENQICAWGRDWVLPEDEIKPADGIGNEML